MRLLAPTWVPYIGVTLISNGIVQKNASHSRWLYIPGTNHDTALLVRAGAVDVSGISCGTPSFAAAFHHFSTVVAKLVFLTSKTIKNASPTTFNPGAKLLHVGATSGPATALLAERR